MYAQSPKRYTLLNGVLTDRQPCVHRDSPVIALILAWRPPWCEPAGVLQWSKLKPCNLLSSGWTFYVKKLCINPKKWASRISMSQKSQHREKSSDNPPLIRGNCRPLERIWRTQFYPPNIMFNFRCTDDTLMSGIARPYENHWVSMRGPSCKWTHADR